MQYQTLAHNEKDCAILGKIEAFIHMSESTERSGHKQTERKRTRNDYFFRGHRICRELFKYVHCIGESQLDKLNKHFREVGVEPRIHGRTKKLPVNAFSYQDTRCVVDFIVNYADVHVITLPGRTPHHWKSDAQLLPTNCTKVMVYEAYKEVIILSYLIIILKYIILCFV